MKYRVRKEGYFEKFVTVEAKDEAEARSKASVGDTVEEEEWEFVELGGSVEWWEVEED